MSKTALFHRRPSAERPLSFSLCLVRGSGVGDDDDDDDGGVVVAVVGER